MGGEVAAGACWGREGLRAAACWVQWKKIMVSGFRALRVPDFGASPRVQVRTPKPV